MYVLMLDTFAIVNASVFCFDIRWLRLSTLKVKLFNKALLICFFKAALIAKYNKFCVIRIVNSTMNNSVGDKSLRALLIR